MSDKAFNTKPYSIIHLELLSYDNVLFVSNFLHTVAGNDIVGTGKYYCHYTIFLSVPHEGNVNKAVLFNKRNSQPQKFEFKVDCILCKIGQVWDGVVTSLKLVF